MNLTYLKS